MTVDLVLLGLVATFALWGAFSGAARQIAQAVAVVVGWLVSRPASTLLGPQAGVWLKTPPWAGTIITALFVFFVTFLFVRWAVTALVLRLLAGRELQHRGADRLLGALLGGAKVAAIAFLVLCAVSFLENNVTLAGTRLDLAPKDSVAVQLSRRFNLFELAQFAGLADLVGVARAVSDPKHGGALKSSPAYQALRKDPRFATALDGAAMRKALESGDTRSLLKDSAVLKLLEDQKAMRQLTELSTQIDQY